MNSIKIPDEDLAEADRLEAQAKQPDDPNVTAWLMRVVNRLVYEKTGPGGQRVVPVAGLVLIACAVLVLAHPAWLPAAVAGGM